MTDKRKREKSHALQQTEFRSKSANSVDTHFKKLSLYQDFFLPEGIFTLLVRFH